MSPVEQLIEKLGGVADTARAFGVAHTSVLKWRKRGEIPLDRIAQASDLLGLQPAEIRPDVAKLMAPRHGLAEPGAPS